MFTRKSDIDRIDDEIIQIYDYIKHVIEAHIQLCDDVNYNFDLMRKKLGTIDEQLATKRSTGTKKKSNPESQG